MSMNEEILRLIYTFVYLVSTLLYRCQHNMKISSLLLIVTTTVVLPQVSTGTGSIFQFYTNKTTPQSSVYTSKYSISFICNLGTAI